MGVISRLVLALAAAVLLGGCGSSGGDTIKPEPSTKNPMSQHAAQAGG